MGISVDSKDGCCDRCGGTVEIVSADEVGVQFACTVCGHHEWDDPRPRLGDRWEKYFAAALLQFSPADYERYVFWSTRISSGTDADLAAAA
jgi:hypothetical protein